MTFGLSIYLPGYPSETLFLPHYDRTLILLTIIKYHLYDMINTDNMGSSKEPPLDEIQWRSPPIAQSMGGIQTNTGICF